MLQVAAVGDCMMWASRDLVPSTCGSRELNKGRDFKGRIKRWACSRCETWRLVRPTRRQTLWSAADNGFYSDVMNVWKPRMGHRFDTELNWSFFGGG
jgi:hypothetical protein